jgi:hypothetical protein
MGVINMILDWIALLRAVVIGLIAGTLTNLIGKKVLCKRVGPARRRRTTISLRITISLMSLALAVALYCRWPSLVKVPLLDKRSYAEAEGILRRESLVPAPTSGYSMETARDLVVPGSQRPAARLFVHPHTPIHYTVSLGRSATAISTAPVSVSLAEPKGSLTARCFRDSDGLYRFNVNGTSRGLEPSSYSLLIWVFPVEPPAVPYGWYLQRQPSEGVHRVETDGRWAGVARIGNQQYPPHNGDKFNLAVSVADIATARQLMAEMGVVVRPNPTGIALDKAENVTVDLAESTKR